MRFNFSRKKTLSSNCYIKTKDESQGYNPNKNITNNDIKSVENQKKQKMNHKTFNYANFNLINLCKY